MGDTLYTDTTTTLHLENAEEFIVLFVHMGYLEHGYPHHCYTHTLMMICV